MDKTPSSVAKKQSIKRDEKKMALTDHLGELRRRIIIVAVSLVVFFAAIFIFLIETIVKSMLSLAEGFQFIYIEPSELVTSYIKLAFVISLVVSSPIILYQIWGFLKPGLKTSEKRAGFGSLLGGFVFFALGITFAYLVAIPFTLDFFVRFETTGMISPMISFENYMSFIINTMLAFGCVFEMPILTVLLSQIGILKPRFMLRFRKYAIFLIFIIAAVITPPDVFSQIMVAIPMMLLFEISIGVCKLIVRRKERRELDDFAEDAE